MNVTDFKDYANRLGDTLAGHDWSSVAWLAEEMAKVWRNGNQVFLCGNGGSAGNAIHLANDFVYGIAKRTGGGLRAIALSANPAVITCLANDVGYESIYAEQLAVQGNPGDLLVVLSGSGNSSNVIAALEQAKKMQITTCAILGYQGGKAKNLADQSIHFEVSDMQIAEDTQLIVGHMVMQYLYKHKK